MEKTLWVYHSASDNSTMMWTAMTQFKLFARAWHRTKSGKKHRDAIYCQLDAVCLLSDDGKEIDRRGTSHVSFHIGYPAWLVTPCHNDLNPFVRTHAQDFDRIAID